jgi:tetraacyldisaccharide-1-P 4'-kinase
MTDKDAVKCDASCHPDAWVLEMETVFPDGFINRLLQRAGLEEVAAA